MEKKKFRLSIVQFLLIIFCTILISVMISVGILYIVNSSTKSSKKKFRNNQEGWNRRGIYRNIRYLFR